MKLTSFSNLKLNKKNDKSNQSLVPTTDLSFRKSLIAYEWGSEWVKARVAAGGLPDLGSLTVEYVILNLRCVSDVCQFL